MRLRELLELIDGRVFIHIEDDKVSWTATGNTLDMCSSLSSDVLNSIVRRVTTVGCKIYINAEYDCEAA